MSDISGSSVGGAPIERRLFSEGQLSVGLTLPLLSSGNIVADFDEQIALAKLSDEFGFSALWVRDVPLNSMDYPDPVGHLDPWVFLGALASHTQKIALVSGAIVLTLRHPLHIAKAAVSVNALSHGRFILGLGSGDRPQEYAAFGNDPNKRRDLYRRHWDTVASAVGSEPRIIPDQSPPEASEFFLLPGGSTPIPMIAVGSGGQSVDWIARNAIGWMTYHREPETQRTRHSMWRAAVDRVAPGEFRAFGVAMALDLAANVDEPAQERSLGYRTGRGDLVKILRKMRDSGTHHVTLSLQASGRATRETLEELAANVLPKFQTADES